MRSINVIKVYNTKEELNESAEFKKMWEGFVMQPIRDHESCKFQKGFLTEDGKIYYIVAMTDGKDEGLRLFHKASICGCLDNNPFLAGYYSESDNTLNIDGDKRYERTSHNRIVFAKNHKLLYAMRSNVAVDCFVSTEMI